MYSPLEDGLIFESLHRSRNTTASVNHNGRRFFVDIHNRPLPRSPPKSSSSPSLRPIAGITLTAVVFEFTIPIAASSAIIADTVSDGVSPGITIISRPTEHTAVIASSFSIVRVLSLAAAIIPASSVTGMNAPESPPTFEEAITPPFLTASVEHCKGSGSAAGSALLKSDFLKYICN